MLEPEMALEAHDIDAADMVLLDRLIGVEGMLRRMECSLDDRLRSVEERLDVIVKSVRQPGTSSWRDASAWKHVRSEDPIGASSGGIEAGPAVSYAASGTDAGQDSLEYRPRSLSRRATTQSQGVEIALITETQSDHILSPTVGSRSGISDFESGKDAEQDSQLQRRRSRRRTTVARTASAGVEVALIAEMEDKDKAERYVQPTYSSEEERIQNLRPRVESKASKHIIAEFHGKNKFANHGEHHSRSHSRLAIHPSSPVRLLYDIACLFASLYDTVMVPLELAYTIELEGFVEVLEVLTLGVWVLDLFLQFFMGYYDNEYVFMDLRRIAKRYIKSEFVPSLVICSCDIFAFILMYAHREAPINLAWARILRVVRVPRGIRAFRRGSRAFQGVILRVAQKGSFYVALRLVQFVAVIVWGAHVCACIWAVFGEQAREKYLMSSFTDQSMSDTSFDYLLNFYWAINIIAAATNIMTPTTAVEHAFIMVALVFGLLSCSVIIGVVGDVLHDLRSTNSLRVTRVIALRKYLQQNHISYQHSKHIENVARSICEHENQHRRMLEEDVELLSHLPPSLHDTLRATVLGPVVCTQVFIHACDALESMLVYNVCSKTLERMVLMPDELVFERGTEAVGAYFILWGKGEYSDMSLSVDAMPSTESQQVGCKKFVNHCQWLCELALFCCWEHHGTLRTAERSEVLKINADSLLAILQQFDTLCSIANEYAQILCQIVQHSGARFESDLQMPVKHEEVVRLMPALERAQMSAAGLNMLNAPSYVSTSGRLGAGLHMLNSPFLVRMGLANTANLSQLTLQVERGTCDLVVIPSMTAWWEPPDTTIHRVIAIAKLRLTDDNGCVLVQIGYFSHDEFFREVKLPGATIEAQELPSHATERLLDGPLSKMKSAITITGRLTDVEVKNSGSYSIETKYIRYIATGVVGSDWATDCDFRHMGELGKDLGVHAFVLGSDISTYLPVYCWADEEFLVSHDMIEHAACGAGEATEDITRSRS